MIITVSDVNGIRQHEIPDSIKKIIISFLFIIVVTIVGLSFYIKTIYNKIAILENSINIERIVEKKKIESQLVFNTNVIKEKKLRDKEEQARLLKQEETKKIELLANLEKAKKEKLAKLEEEKKVRLAKAKKEAELKAEKARKAEKEKLAKLEEEKKVRLDKAKKE